MCEKFCIGAPRLHNFCCLCSLRQGVFIISIYQIIQLIISIYSYIYLDKKQLEEAKIVQIMMEIGLSRKEIPGFIALAVIQAVVFVTCLLLLAVAFMEIWAFLLFPWMVAKGISVIIVFYIIISRAFNYGGTDIMIWWAVQGFFSIYMIAIVGSYHTVLLGGGISGDSADTLDDIL